METLANQDPEEIKKLTNGHLERVVNKVLRYEVKMSDLQVMNRVLDAYWYTPAKDMNLEQSKEFLSSEYKKERQVVNTQEDLTTKPAGKYLFETIQSFVDRFIRAEHIDNLENGFDKIENIFESIKDELNPSEQRAVIAIVTYLKGRQILGIK